MKKVLIIEDDHFSARRLKRLVMDIDDTIDVYGPLKSIMEVVAELTNDFGMTSLKASNTSPSTRRISEKIKS